MSEGIRDETDRVEEIRDGSEHADTERSEPVHATAPRAIVLYLLAFGLLIASVAVIGIGAIVGFSTFHFWISILLSVLAIGAAGAAVLPARARSVD